MDKLLERRPAVAGSRTAAPTRSDQGGHVGRNAVDHRREVEVAMAPGDHARTGARQLDELPDLGITMAGKRRNRYAAHFLQAEIQQHELGDVRQLRHDAILRLEAHLEQIQRQVAMTGDRAPGTSTGGRRRSGQPVGMSDENVTYSSASDRSSQYPRAQYRAANSGGNGTTPGS